MASSSANFASSLPLSSEEGHHPGTLFLDRPGGGGRSRPGAALGPVERSEAERAVAHELEHRRPAGSQLLPVDVVELPRWQVVYLRYCILLAPRWLYQWVGWTIRGLCSSISGSLPLALVMPRDSGRPLRYLTEAAISLGSQGAGWRSALGALGPTPPPGGFHRACRRAFLTPPRPRTRAPW